VEELHDDDRDCQGYSDAVGGSTHRAIPSRGWTRLRLYTLKPRPVSYKIRRKDIEPLGERY
jgi:hypothetical protein